MLEMDATVLKVLILLDFLLSSRAQISNSTFFREGTKVERKCLCDLCHHQFEEQCSHCDCCKNDSNKHTHAGEFNNTYDDNLTDPKGRPSRANYYEAHWYKNQTRTKNTSKLGSVSYFGDDKDAVKYLFGGSKASCRIFKLTPKILINTTEAPYNYLEMHFQSENENKLKRRITDQARVLFHTPDMFIQIPLHDDNQPYGNPLLHKHPRAGSKNNTFFKIKRGMFHSIPGIASPLMIGKFPSHVIGLLNTSFILVVAWCVVLLSLFLIIFVLSSVLFLMMRDLRN